MKVYLVDTYDGITKCFESYEEAKRCADIVNLTINGCYTDVEEVELQQRFSNPSEFFVRGLVRIPYLCIACGEENVEKIDDKMSTHIEIKHDVDENYIKRYEDDTSSTLLYSSSISTYFYFKLQFVENETREDLYKRAKHVLLNKLDKFKTKDEFDEVIKISYLYKEMKEKIDKIAKTIDK